MNAKERLVELLFDAIHRMRLDYPEAAEWLIAHGVTVWGWISVKDRLPAQSGYYLVMYRDEFYDSKSVSIDFYTKCASGEWWGNDFGRTAIGWMPLPEGDGLWEEE